MNILIVLPEDSLGGAELYLKKIASYHINDNVYIYFFKNAYSNKWSDLDNQIHLYFLTLLFIFPLQSIRPINFIFFLLVNRLLVNKAISSQSCYFAKLLVNKDRQSIWRLSSVSTLAHA